MIQRKVCVFLGITLMLFSSCSFMQKAGIEKRRYRPGIYLNITSSLEHSYRNIIKNTANVCNERKVITDVQPKESLKVSLPNKISINSGAFFTKCIRIKQSKNSKTHLQTLPPSTNMSLGYYPVVTRDNTITSTEHIEHCGDSVGGELAGLVATIIYCLTALAIKAIFPTMSITWVAILAFVVVVIMAVAAIVIIDNY